MSTQKRLFTAMTPSFCSLTNTKQSLQYTIKTHLSGPPMPKFEANMNYIPPSPPSSMKQCNKSATVKFHMELLLILRPGSNLTVVRHLLLFVGLTFPLTKSVIKPLTLQSRPLLTLSRKHFKNIMGLGENAGYKHFLLYSPCFLPFPKQISSFQSHLFCRLQMFSI